MLTTPQLEAAIAFRTKLGLQADVAWILRVAADPASQPGLEAYGTPLSPQETAELDRRARDGAALSEAVTGYGAKHWDAFAGAYMEAQTGVFVARFTGSVEVHERSLRQLVNPSARLEVRSARWSQAELSHRQARVTGDLDWLESIAARFAGIGIDPIRNAVILKISSANAAAPGRLVEHFEGTGWLVVESDGIGYWQGPYGRAVIKAVTKSHAPGPFLMCYLVPDEPSAWIEDTYLTDETGICRIDSLPASTYTVEMKVLPEDGSPWVVVGRGPLTVPAHGVGTVTVGVDLP